MMSVVVDYDNIIFIILLQLQCLQGRQDDSQAKSQVKQEKEKTVKEPMPRYFALKFFSLSLSSG